MSVHIPRFVVKTEFSFLNLTGSRDAPGLTASLSYHPGPPSESDTESLDDGASDAGVAEEVGPVETVLIPFEMPQHEAIVRGFASLDVFELNSIFRCRAVVMRSVPCILRGAFWSVLRIAVEEAVAGLEVFDEVRQDRAWKLFLFLPRMLLHRPARGRLVPKAKLIERFAKFAQWPVGRFGGGEHPKRRGRISSSHSQAQAARG